MALDMLFAGIDTSSHTIAFALYHLAKNPTVQVGCMILVFNC